MAVKSGRAARGREDKPRDQPPQSERRPTICPSPLFGAAGSPSRTTRGPPHPSRVLKRPRRGVCRAPCSSVRHDYPYNHDAEKNPTSHPIRPKMGSEGSESLESPMTTPDHAPAPAALGSDTAPMRWHARESGRYYVATAQRNLWGEWEVWRAWGAVGTRRGGERFDPALDQRAALEALAAVAARREKRGYRRAP